MQEQRGWLAQPCDTDGVRLIASCGSSAAAQPHQCMTGAAASSASRCIIVTYLKPPGPLALWFCNRVFTMSRGLQGEQCSNAERRALEREVVSPIGRRLPELRRQGRRSHREPASEPAGNDAVTRTATIAKLAFYAHHTENEAQPLIHHQL